MSELYWTSSNYWTSSRDYWTSSRDYWTSSSDYWTSSKDYWTSSKSGSEKHVCNTQWKRMGSRRWNMELIFHTVVLIVVSDMYLEKKYVLTILNPSTTPNAAVGSKFSLRDLLISKFSKSRYCSRVDLKQLHALKNYFQIHCPYYTWLASWSRVVARCPAMVLWSSNIFGTYKLSFTGRPVI